MIRIEALPGGVGDCLWISGDAPDGEHRMLVDGGRHADALRDRLAAQPVAARAFDLVVCSHIDDDHILGLLPLFERRPDGFAAADVWFNARRHLLLSDAMGAKSGDRLSKALGTVPGQAWNAAFCGRAVALPDAGGLPTHRLPGLTVTVLSPAGQLLVWSATSVSPRRAIACTLRPGPTAKPKIRA